jgi:acyl transferase domain-containing protein
MNDEPEVGAVALRRAAEKIRQLQAELAASTVGHSVAVVGLGLRLPGRIADADVYWAALAAGRDLVDVLPEQRREPFEREWVGVHQIGGFLDDVLGFDPAVFEISSREAMKLDPQQRLLLEVTWEALEDAAIPPASAALPVTGYYVGVTSHDYDDWRPEDPDFSWRIGSAHCFAAGRVAHTLGLKGPAMAVDTACSSSLVAVHLARQALLGGECDIGVAAGVNLIMSPRSSELIGLSGLLAPDGRCRSFDARANGFTRSEGCGVVVLKRLTDAVRDGDRIHAVLAGSAVNQDGRSASITAPSVTSQSRLLSRSLATARLQPSDIGFVEAHGTGTALGDPIEMEAIVAALGRRNGGAPIAVGSVKANAGHLESAAGIAGLIKAILTVRERQFVPLPHFHTLNPRIDLDGTAISVPAAPMGWPDAAGRYAMVSSFGMSGTNANVIVGAAPDGSVSGGAGTVAGFELSARTDTALRARAEAYRGRLTRLPPNDYPAFAYTATFGRARHAVRAWIDAVDPATAATALQDIASGAAYQVRDRPAPPMARAVIDLPAYPWERRRYATVPATVRETAALRA